MDFYQALDFLEEAPRGHNKGHAPMMMLLELLGHPEEDLNFIHIAGTNGKGSVTAILRALMEQVGQKVGLFTSPHLVDYRERMTVGGNLMGDESLVEYVEEMKVCLDYMERELDMRPSYFELSLVLALLYFSDEAVDFVLMEAGIGGREDATNLMPHIKMQVFTPIALDHRDMLGDNLSQIAKNKSGIIKRNSRVVSADQEEEVRKILIDKADDMGSDLDFIESQDIHDIILDENGTYFKIWDKDYFVPLIGRHQAQNAALAIKVMQDLGFNMKALEIELGLKRVELPGRFQILSDRPLIIADGAHNSHAIRALYESLVQLYGEREIILILASMKDKDLGDDLFRLLNMAKKVYITGTGDETRSRGASDYNFTHPNLEFLDESQAFSRAEEADEDDLVLITGSLYLVGEAIEYFLA